MNIDIGDFSRAPNYTQEKKAADTLTLPQEKMADAFDSAAPEDLTAASAAQHAAFEAAADKKRGREEAGGADGKRSKVEAEEPTVLKMLLPNESAGRVIGKAGAVLKQIMDDSGARVRFSATDEVIPDTGERIITAVGSAEAVALVADFVQAILNEPSPGEEVDPSKAKPLKLLVPEATAGSVIGKAGAVIKELMDVSGATIRVSTDPTQTFSHTAHTPLHLAARSLAVPMCACTPFSLYTPACRLPVLCFAGFAGVGDAGGDFGADGDCERGAGRR
jgi:predicted PilT family ATPase